MTQVAEAVQIEVGVTGLRESSSEFTSTAKVWEQQTLAVNEVFNRLISTTQNLDTRIRAIEKDFQSTATETQNLQSKTKTLAGSFESAAAAFGQAEARMHTFGSSASQAEAEVARLKKEVQSLKDELDDGSKSGTKFGDIFKGALAAGFVQAGIQRAGAEIKEFISSSIDASMQMERLTRTFKFAGGSAEAGAQEFAFVRSEANRLGLDLSSTAAEYAKLTAASVGTSLAGEKTRNIFKAVSEAGTTLGLSADSQAGALNAIQQMMSKGTVQAEELRGQLGERLPGAFQIASRAMGVSTMALGKMLEQGQVMSSDFLPKFADEVHKTYGQAAIEAAGGGQASFNRFNNSMLESKAILGEQLMPVVVSFAEYVSKEALPFWVDFFQEINDGTKYTAALREEMERIRDLQGTGSMAMSPDVEIEAKKNLAIRKAALAEAMEMQKQERLKNDAYAKPLPANEQAGFMSAERLSNIASLRKELTTAQINSEKEGFDAERAIADADYQAKKVKYAGQATEMELAREGHIAKLAAIDKKQADHDAKELLQSESNGVDFAKIKKAREDKDVQDDENRTKAHYESQKFFRDQDIDLEENSYEKKKKQLAAHFQEMREATMDANSKDLKHKADYTNSLLLLDKKEKDAQKKLALENAIVRTQAGVGMFGDLLKAMDGFYSQSKKNANLHKAINIGLIEMDGAVAAMEAYKDLGPVAGVIAAIFIEAKTQAAAFQVANQKFTGGGIVQGDFTSGDRINIGVNAGEMILNPMQQATLFAIANGQGGGKSVTNNFSLQYTAGDISLAGDRSGNPLVDYMQRQPSEFARAFNDLVKRGFLQGAH